MISAAARRAIVGFRPLRVYAVLFRLLNLDPCSNNAHADQVFVQSVMTFSFFCSTHGTNWNQDQDACLAIGHALVQRDESQSQNVVLFAFQ